MFPTPNAPDWQPAVTSVGHPPAHLLLPFAAVCDDQDRPLLPGLALPHLQRLVAWASGCAVVAVAHGDARTSLTPPHEWALAQACGLLPGIDPGADAPTTWPDAHDGLLPWAAWSAPQALATPDAPAAWFTPCHQEIGTGQVTLHPPARLALSDAHSKALLAALQPLALEDGLHLSWLAADAWLAQGPALAHLPAASLDRVAGRSIAPWVPTGAATASVRRLQSEAQMLFYTHPANDEREAQGQPPINAFWVSGTGACPPSARRAAPELVVPDHLRTPALRGDWVAWRQAWEHLDAQVLPAWLAHAQAGHPLRLTLCGERACGVLQVGARSAWQVAWHKTSSFFKLHRTSEFISQL